MYEPVEALDLDVFRELGSGRSGERVQGSGVGLHVRLNNNNNNSNNNSNNDNDDKKKKKKKKTNNCISVL